MSDIQAGSPTTASYTHATLEANLRERRDGARENYREAKHGAEVKVAQEVKILLQMSAVQEQGSALDRLAVQQHHLTPQRALKRIWRGYGWEWLSRSPAGGSRRLVGCVLLMNLAANVGPELLGHVAHHV